MAWIEKREGVKKTSYRVHYKDRFTGKKRNKSFGLRKKAQAFLETIGSQENTVTHSHATATVKDAMERWYTICTTTGRDGRPPVERSTYDNYEHHKKIIIELIGNKKLSELSKPDCNELRDRLLNLYSRSYAKKFLTSFKSGLKQAVTDELIPKSPADSTTILIAKRDAKASRKKIPSMQEISQLTQAIETLMTQEDKRKRDAWARYGPFFYTMLYTGMRPSEMRGLAWSSIDWDKNRITVKRRADAYCKLGPLKSGAAYRVISVADSVMNYLREWQERCPHSEYDLVFPNYRGNVENPRNLARRGWFFLCQAAGLTYTDDDGKERTCYHPYSLRHAKASLEIALNRSPKRIQTLMGHADIQITFNTYGHLFEDESLQDDPNDLEKLIRMGAKQVPAESQTTDINA